MDHWAVSRPPSDTSSPTADRTPRHTVAQLSTTANIAGEGPMTYMTTLGNWAKIHTTATVRLWDVNKCCYMCLTVGIITNNPTVSHIQIQKVVSFLSTPWRHTGGVQVQLHSFSVSALDGGERSTSRPSSSFTLMSGQLHVRAALPWWAVNFTSGQLYP